MPFTVNGGTPLTDDERAESTQHIDAGAAELRRARDIYARVPRSGDEQRRLDKLDEALRAIDALKAI